MKTWIAIVTLAFLGGCAAFAPRDGKPAPIVTTLGHVFDAVDAVSDSAVGDALAASAGPFGLLALGLYRTMRRRQRASVLLAQEIEAAGATEIKQRVAKAAAAAGCADEVHRIILEGQRRQHTGRRFPGDGVIVTTKPAST